MTLPYPSRSQFRKLVLVGTLMWVVLLALIFSNITVSDQATLDALSWNTYGSLFSPNITYLIQLITLAIMAIGLIGMLGFKSWGRFLILASFIIDTFTTPFLGLVIYTGLMDFLVAICGLFIFIPWVLSFFEPCSAYFLPQKDGSEQSHWCQDWLNSSQPLRRTGTGKATLTWSSNRVRPDSRPGERNW